MIKINSEKLSDNVKKNLLDLEFNKKLQYLNIVIIGIITYTVGLGIAFLLGQINFRDGGQVGSIIFISTIAYSLSILSVLNLRNHLENIKTEIKKLKL